MAAAPLSSTGNFLFGKTASYFFLIIAFVLFNWNYYNTWELFVN